VEQGYQEDREDAKECREQAAKYNTGALNPLLAYHLGLVTIALEVGRVGLCREHRGSVELHIANARNGIGH